MRAPPRIFRTRAALAVGLAVLSAAADAAAHIDLLAPQARELGASREPNSNVKSAPCGQEVNGRTERVSVFEPGASVEVTWVETTNHRSYYRVAFDVDGDDDFPSFLGNGVGTEGIDPRGLCPVDGQVILAYDMEDRSGGSHTLRVRLPDVECERCTLQVIQFMYDTGRPYYYQCADLALRRSPPRDLAPDAGSAPDAGAIGASASDAGAAASDGGGAVGAKQSPRAAPGCWSRIAPDTRRGDPRDDDDDDAPAPAAAAPSSAGGPGGGESSAPVQRRSDGGCSIRSPSARGVRAGSDSSAHAWLSALGVWALSRWRRPRGERATG